MLTRPVEEDLRSFGSEVPSVLEDRSYRLGIVGGRDFPFLDWPRILVWALPAGVEVVSGGAEGVDLAAETEAHARPDLPAPRSFPVEDWYRSDGSFDRGAGMRRNGVVVAYVDGVCAFWDRRSRGTANTIERALRVQKLLAVWDERGRRLSETEIREALAEVERLRRARRGPPSIRIRGSSS